MNEIRRRSAEEDGSFESVIIEDELTEDQAFWLEHVVNKALRPGCNVAGTRSKKPINLNKERVTPA